MTEPRRIKCSDCGHWQGKTLKTKGECAISACGPGLMLGPTTTACEKFKEKGKI